MSISNVEPWYYILAIPGTSADAAESVAPALGNPDGIVGVFQRYPRTVDAEGNVTYPDVPESKIIFIATTLAFENAEDGAPSKELLEENLNDNPDLQNIIWWRMDNPWKPGNNRAILRAKHQSAAGVVGKAWGYQQALASLEVS